MHSTTSSYLLESERRLVQLMHSPLVVKANAVKAINDNNDIVATTVSNLLAPKKAQVDAAFNDADKRWNEWSIFIGFMTVGNTAIPLISFNGGSISINFPWVFNNVLPLINIPGNVFH